jgi:N-acylneuraminate cytidylyltransferase
VDGAKKILAIIPARGGSKGIHKKNIVNLAGKPLIAWTIEAAKKSTYIDCLILSSDDPEIIKVASEWGCEVPFIRPPELALDDTPGIAPVLHAIETLQEKYDYVVLLQPTSPLRHAEDIDGCIKKCLESGAPACVSVAEPDKSPYWMYTVGSSGRMQPLIETGETFNRRQDLPQVFALNGAVYVADCRWLETSRTFVTPETTAYLMPKERSIDIDTLLDLKLVELLIVQAR